VKHDATILMVNLEIAVGHAQADADIAAEQAAVA
jgi:hypothetical protein